MVTEPIKSPARKAGLFAFPPIRDKRLKIAGFLNLYNGKTGSTSQAHTTSPSASGAFVSCAANVHRIPQPTSVTIAVRPSYEGGTGLILPVICGSDQRFAAAANWHDGQIRR